MAQARLHASADRTTWRAIDGQVIVLDLAESEYFSLNATASLLWTQVAAGSTFEDLVADLCREFAVTEDVARVDATKFVEDGQQRGWIALT